jgi:hypothetical protein
MLPSFLFAFFGLAARAVWQDIRGGSGLVNASMEEEIDQHQQKRRNAAQPCQEILAHDVLLVGIG